MDDALAQIQIVSTAERPDLVPVVAQWLWRAFWREDGHSLDDVLAVVNETVTAPLMPKCFVLIHNGKPVGTASLAKHDLNERPDLSPWLAGVFVEPEARGRGFATRLIAIVEKYSRKASIGTLWLYTHSAEPLYKRVGWHKVEVVQHRDKQISLMRREL